MKLRKLSNGQVVKRSHEAGTEMWTVDVVKALCPHRRYGMMEFPGRFVRHGRCEENSMAKISSVVSRRLCLCGSISPFHLLNPFDPAFVLTISLHDLFLALLLILSCLVGRCSCFTSTFASSCFFSSQPLLSFFLLFFCTGGQGYQGDQGVPKFNRSTCSKGMCGRERELVLQPSGPSGPYSSSQSCER